LKNRLTIFDALFQKIVWSLAPQRDRGLLGSRLAGPSFEREPDFGQRENRTEECAAP